MKNVVSQNNFDFFRKCLRRLRHLPNVEIIGEIFLEIAKGDLLFENYTPNLNGEVKLRLRKRNPEKSLVYQLLWIIKLLFFYSSFANAVNVEYYSICN